MEGKKIVLGGPTWPADGSNITWREYGKKIEKFNDDEGILR